MVTTRALLHRGPLLCNMVQRLPRTNNRHRLDKGLQDIPPVENAFLPYNRNGVLFPEKINGNFAMLSRPSDTGHTPFGDIFYSESPDMEFWGRHRHVMAPAAFELSAWQCMKIGAGPVPVKTSEAGCCSTTACSALATAMFTHSVLPSSTSSSLGRLHTVRSVPHLSADSLRVHGRRAKRMLPMC